MIHCKKVDTQILKEPIKYFGGYKYQLAANFYFHISIRPAVDIETEYLTLHADGLLIVRKGYAWDGASGLTIDTKSSMRGALVHDALYQLMRMEEIAADWRGYTDELLRDICKDDGMFWWRANIWYKAVKRFGKQFVDPKNKKKIIVAP